MKIAVGQKAIRKRAVGIFENLKTEKVGEETIFYVVLFQNSELFKYQLTEEFAEAIEEALKKGSLKKGLMIRLNMVLKPVVTSLDVKVIF